MLQWFKYLLILILLFLWIDNGNELIKKSMDKTETKDISLKSKNIESIFEAKTNSFKYISTRKKIIAKSTNTELTTLASQNINFENKKAISNNLEDRNFGEKTITNNQNVSFLKIVFDNDIFNNTDYYYTNGVRIELVTGFISHAPTSRILPGLNNSDYDFQGFSIVQNIYTPVNPDTKEIQLHDRPFSGYLTVGHFRNSINIEKGLKMRSEICFGILGPASLGGVVQSSIHEADPVGWENQIQNDIVIDYSFQIEKAVIRSKHFEGNANANVRLGTTFNNLGGGISMRTGNFLPIIENQLPGILKFGSKKIKFWLFAKTSLKFVAYDATLQGGLFNTSNYYVLENSKINRLQFEASAGLAVYYNKIGLELENFYMSPEFEGAYDFRYGRININIGLW
jgi:hypothetical protein